MKSNKRLLAVIICLALVFTTVMVPQTILVNAASRPETISLARKAAREGVVMLKNEEGVLPLKANAPVSVFGRCQIDTFSGGYGTGVGPSTDYPPITLLEGFDNNPVISYNETLADIYRAWVKENPVTGGGWGNWPANHPEMPLTEEMVADARAVSDTAVVIIGRAAGEDRELKFAKGEIFLSDQEIDMLEKVNAKFDKIIILMNVGNVIDMSWVKDYSGIKGILYMWQGGIENGNVIADVLAGDVSPSGKLADTVATSFYDYPSSDTFGMIDGDSLNEIYSEDIYVGYRYFETFAPDKVLYPFGFGLSYTTFDIDASQKIEGENIVITAKVTNTGESYSGKEVVQVYYSAPQGNLGKPAVELAAYAKTNEIAPGASQTLTITFPVKNMSSYDDSGRSGFESAWVMEAGEYKILVGNSCRELEQVGSYTVNETVVTEQLEEASAPVRDYDRIYPVEDEEGNITLGYEPTPKATTDLAQRVIDNLPEAVEMTGDKGIKLIDVYNGDAAMDEFLAQLTVAELAVLTRGAGYQSYSDGKYIQVSSNGGSYGGITPELVEKGILPTSNRGTPAGIGAGGKRTKLPIATMLACTFNNDLVEELYYFVGMEGLDAKLDVHLAPSMNIHRNPMCGRNFEYFSEDPLLTGKMAAAAVIGAQRTGMSSCPKHYALNNQEASRRGSDSVASERAQREIYLKGFEICVKEANPDNIMASYNKINGVYSHYHYDLATTILREQWGWDGVLMTDWWLMEASSAELGVANDAWRVRAQVDVNMPGAKPGLIAQDSVVMGDIAANVGDSVVLAAYEEWVAAGSPTDRLVGLTLGELQRSARNVLTYLLESRVFRLSNGLELDRQDATGYEYFTVSGNTEETVPELSALTIEGMPDFSAFSPSITFYKVFLKDMNNLPKVYAKTGRGVTATVIQATAENPVATITVNNEGGKNVYRVIFTNEVGMTPVVNDPVYARLSDVRFNDISFAAFYPTVYSYDLAGKMNEVEVTAVAPEGVTATVKKDVDNQKIIIRCESDDQANEYEFNFGSDISANKLQPDTFDSASLSPFWKVINKNGKMSVSDGAVKIVPEPGEWYGTNETSSATTIDNLVYQEAEGDFIATVDFVIPAGQNSKNTNQFGLVAFEDSGNYVDLLYQTSSSGSYTKWNGHFFATRNETDNYIEFSEIIRDGRPYTEGWQNSAEAQTVSFRLKKVGDTYTFYYRTEKMKESGEGYHQISEYTKAFSTPKIGFFAAAGNNADVRDYTVDFTNFDVVYLDGSLQSDSFDRNEIKSFWTVDNKLTDKIKFSDENMTLTTEYGEWYQSNEDTNPIDNLFYQKADGNWTATLTLTIPNPAAIGGLDTNQFILSAFDDSDHFVDIGFFSTPYYGKPFFLSSRQESGSSYVVQKLIEGNPLTAEGWGSAPQTISFRINKSGNTYTTYYQTQAMKVAGTDFVAVKSYTASFAEPKIGFYATCGAKKGAVPSDVTIENFVISDYAPPAKDFVPEEEPQNVTVSSTDTTAILAADDVWYLSSSLSTAETADATYVTDTNGGQYALYGIKVEKAGYYKIAPTIAALDTSSGGAMLELDIELDGDSLAGYRPGTTGGWTAWVTADAKTVWLPEGTHKLRFNWGSSANLKNIIITPCTDSEANAQRVADAKAIISARLSAPSVTKETANTEAALTDWLKNEIEAVLSSEEKLSGVELTSVSLASFTSARYENGSFSFTAELKSGDSTAITDLTFGTITVDLAAYDINDDKVINVCDVVALTEKIANSNATVGYDVNGDGIVDSNDIAAIRTYIISN